MSPAQARSPAQAGASLPAGSSTMSIGEVLGQLRPDFPDVSISKIRFLEAEGLIQPQRSPSGYRRFTDDDVARLRYVLTVQRDHYLPLRVIKEQLAQLDRGMELIADGGSSVTPYTAAPSRGSAAPDVALSRSSLLEAAGIEEALLADLESYGLVAPNRTGTYDAQALLVARTAGELAEFGLQPRHLRAVRMAAERELSLVEQVVAPIRRQRGVDAPGRAQEAATQVARLTTRLHAAFVEAGLRAVAGR